MRLICHLALPCSYEPDLAMEFLFYILRGQWEHRPQFWPFFGMPCPPYKPHIIHHRYRLGSNKRSPVEFS